MDILRRDYSTYSDDEEDDDGDRRRPEVPSQPKRLRSDGPSHWAESSPTPLLPGRYISKRERDMVSVSAAVTSSSSALLPALPIRTDLAYPTGDIMNSEPPREVLESARSRGQPSKCYGRVLTSLNAHSGAVNTVEWSQSHAHLLASAGMDQTVRVWNVWNKKEKLALVFNSHNAAVKDVKWSPMGLSLLSCGYDCSSRLVDVQKGIEAQVFMEDQIVTSIQFHPSNPELFLSGGMKGSLRLWDIRSGMVVKEYIKSLGSILDIEFSRDAKYFISSSDVSGSNISENAIIFWDISREIPLSNQIYTEAYACPCIRCHPFDCSFIAQSHGNYIALFSSKPPFRLDRFKRYEKHDVSGFPIKCNFSPDGKEIISGSADGYMYFYSYRSSELLRKIKVFNDACIDVALHPHVSNIIASCSWSGEISIFW